MSTTERPPIPLDESSFLPNLGAEPDDSSLWLGDVYEGSDAGVLRINAEYSNRRSAIRGMRTGIEAERLVLGRAIESAFGVSIEYLMSGPAYREALEDLKTTIDQSLRGEG